MTRAEKTAGKIKQWLHGAATVGKCLLRSGTPFDTPAEERHRPLIIMGNGPSLADVLSRNPRAIRESDLMAVNFAPNSNMFFDLKPQMLVLADPHFFDGSEKDQAVARLWNRLQNVTWPLTLYVPVARVADAKKLLGHEGKRETETATSIVIKPFNLTPAEGGKKLCHYLYDRGLAMPRPRNVLIPAIMIAMRERYRDIKLVGADHSWSRTLWVDDQNRVISIQPHFYPDSEKERSRVAKEYEGYHLHDIFHSLSIAFRSYFSIASYAEERGIRIINCTPGSFIDAFRRADIEQSGK